MIAPHESFKPKTKKEKVFYYGMILFLVSVVSGIVINATIQIATNINGRHLEFITKMESGRIFITQSTDNNNDILYGWYDLAKDVVVPQQIIQDVENHYGSWAYVTLDWGTVTKVEVYV